MELRRDRSYKLLPSFSNAILKQLELQARISGQIEPDQHINILNINMIKEEISANINKFIANGDVDISKLNSKEFIDGEVVDVE